MLNATAKITNKRGLHARASAKVVEAAARFQAEITIIKDGQRVNARSIMNFCSLRSAETAQREIREYSIAVEEIFSNIMPVTADSWIANNRITP